MIFKIEMQKVKCKMKNAKCKKLGQYSFIYNIKIMAFGFQWEVRL